eukprot:TRINITY_DN75348_c0_g1_i1.p1 TRINITY_DN75348_c0_g1~~TRINITY_DN75348_c0_g1_i1.p1  ORF type:complete len:501 (+),score=169.17 TRINITY_DN75348_c0_g1_i1:108-1505(+)
MRAASGSAMRQVRRAVVATPLSANEMHCLELKGMCAHSLAFGNSVQSLGIVRGFTSFISARRGGHNAEISRLVRDGRTVAFDRMVMDAKSKGSDGVIGVSADIGPLSQMVEFTSYGSGVRPAGGGSGEDTGPIGNTEKFFSATCSGEQYNCLVESGFSPRSVVFGNHAYSKGVLGMIRGNLRTSLMSGEVPSYSDVFNTARSNALAKLREDAFSKGCNFVSGVRMQSVRLPFVQEVSFVGTGCIHPSLPSPASPDEVFTSSLPEEELWSLIAIGRRPVSVLTGCSVYNMGFGRYLTGMVQQVKGGESSRYRELTAQARDSVMKQLEKKSNLLGADEVVSVRVVIDEIRPGLIEFFAYGTAVVHDARVAVTSNSLPPQVLLGKRKGFMSSTNLTFGHFGESPADKRAAEAHARAHGTLVGLILSPTVRLVLRRFFAGILAVLGRVFPFLSSASKRLLKSPPPPSAK